MLTHPRLCGQNELSQKSSGCATAQVISPLACPAPCPRGCRACVSVCVWRGERQQACEGDRRVGSGTCHPDPPVLGHQGQQHPSPISPELWSPLSASLLGVVTASQRGGCTSLQLPSQVCPTPCSLTPPTQEHPHSCLTPNHQRSEAGEGPPRMQGLIPGKPGELPCVAETLQVPLSY